MSDLVPNIGAEGHIWIKSCGFKQVRSFEVSPQRIRFYQEYVRDVWHIPQTPVETPENDHIFAIHPGLMNFKDFFIFLEQRNALIILHTKENDHSN